MKQSEIRLMLENYIDEIHGLRKLLIEDEYSHDTAIKVLYICLRNLEKHFKIEINYNE